ncbi:uncharacterized protein LOC141659755 [Apium graveolens]|uniref:uncharacterized protein LOC141659755 n=1 Tax=Apium graveolens TaxID=4045 RepID=UPI003D7AC793
MSASKIEIPLKVLIHKQEERVVLAETNSDFVDILFSFLTLPMGTIVRLLSSHVNASQPEAIGIFSNLYGSIANLEDTYFASVACKDVLLNTRNSAEALCEKLKVNIDGDNPIDYFTCVDHNCTGYLSISRFVRCSKCSKLLNRRAYFHDTTSGDQQGVFVQPTASFIVMDDLHVIPNIPALTLALVENSGVTDFGVLEEKTFQIGHTEILDLLKYSILSKTPLTSSKLAESITVIYFSFNQWPQAFDTDRAIQKYSDEEAKGR